MRIPRRRLRPASTRTRGVDPFGLELDEIRGQLAAPDADALFGRIYGQFGLVDAGDSLGQRLAPLEPVQQLALHRGKASDKHLLRLPSGLVVEVVVIHRIDGETACVSSQQGCGVRCGFCASGSEGLVTNLDAADIVRQVAFIQPRPTRVVFMGMGEPFHNYDNVLKAIRIIRERRGLSIPDSRIMISTSGHIPGILRLMNESCRVQLTVSLHATKQSTRDYLVPGMKKHKLSDLLAACDSFTDRTGRGITYAYVLLSEVNDTPDDAKRLVAIVRDRTGGARVNLLRLNAFSGQPFKRSSRRRTEAFAAILRRGGVSVTTRSTQGAEISAACGQLAIRK